MDVKVIIKQLEQERARIDVAIAALKELPGKSGVVKTRTLSEEGRARIAAAAKARWARQKAGMKKKK